MISWTKMGFGGLGAALLLASGSAFGANDGVTKAREACRYLGGADTVNECLKTWRDVEYVDGTALDVCRYLGGSDTVLQCFKVIRDRRYEASEISTCRYLGGSDKVVTCLESTGRRAGGKLARRQRIEDEAVVEAPGVRVSIDDGSLSLRGERRNAGLRATLRRALEAVRSGDKARAEALLEAALDSTR